MQTVEVAACPICRGGLVSLGIPEDVNVRALNARITVDYAMCSACAFVCQSRVLPLDELMRYYQDSPKLREPVPTATDCALHAAQVEFMQRTGDVRERRILDIGADMGKFLDYLAGAHGCRTYYEEENRTARAWLEAGGRHIDAAAASTCAAFDWIVLSQVLEHIVDPVPMLESLRKRLTPDGNVFIEVPHHGFWDDLDIGFFFEHVNYFSPASLTAALDRAGFHVLALEVTTDRHYFDGRCRIIRVCARPRSARAGIDIATIVREHERKHKTARVNAIVTLARALEAGGVALYGAADLADFVIREASAAGCEIAAIFDTDARKHGRPFAGFIIRAPAEIERVRPGAIVIVSSAEADIRATIEATGYRGRIACWSELHGV